MNQEVHTHIVIEVGGGQIRHGAFTKEEVEELVKDLLLGELEVLELTDYCTQVGTAGGDIFYIYELSKMLIGHADVLVTLHRG